MKKYFFLVLIILSLKSISLYGQQHFYFKYKLNTDFNKKGQLLEVSEDKKNKVKSWVGFVEANKIINSKKPKEDTLSIFNLKPKVDYKKLKIEKTIRCTITINDSKDTMTINPWYAIDNDKRLKDSNDSLISINQENTYKYVINNWALSKIGKYPYIDLPYNYRQLTVTNLPLRVNLKTGNVQADFLNINVAYFWICGMTRIFQSKFVDNRNRYWGIGPYIGGGVIEEDEKDLFGINYGFNGIISFYNMSLILAVGAESGIQSNNNKFNPYLALGIGVKLSDLFEPSLKSD